MTIGAIQGGAPAVSVVLPTRNRADLLERPIESVLCQEFGDFELIVVDDGSTDGTKERVAAFGDPRIVYLGDDQHHGGNAARNRGIRASSGRIVCFLDDDDAYLPCKLGHVVRYFENHLQRDVLVDSFELRHPTEAKPRARNRRNPVLEDSESLARAVATRYLYKPTGSFSVRRPALFAAGLFDETLRRRQDMDLLLRLTRSARCASTNEVLWTKYETPGSISSRRDTLVRAIIQITLRHPDCMRRSDYRSGVSRDIARQLWRFAVHGEWSSLRADLARVTSHWGVAKTLRLLLRGFYEMGRREISGKG